MNNFWIWGNALEFQINFNVDLNWCSQFEKIVA